MVIGVAGGSGVKRLEGEGEGIGEGAFFHFPFFLWRGCGISSLARAFECCHLRHALIEILSKTLNLFSSAPQLDLRDLSAAQ
jgi:hypothetical protein